MSDLPTVRWGIVTTGMIASWFVEDLTKPDWPEKSANHIIQCVGGSSLSKAKDFIETFVPSDKRSEITPYEGYDKVWNDPDVTCVYIGTPMSFHKQNCLDAIKAGKNVLCEKAFAMNAKEAEEVFAAAKEKGVFIMEALWTRFYPLMKRLQKFLHEEQRLGKIYRTFCDFGLDMDIENLPEGSRYKDPALGAGSLLDIGIYSLTWGITTLTDQVGDAAEDPEVSSIQTIAHQVDVASSIVLHYKSTGRQAICTSTTNGDPSKSDWGRIEGSKGYVVLSGHHEPSSPESFTFYPKNGGEAEHFTFDKPGRGFWWEADAVAHDLKAGRQQNATMPWSETLRVLKIMDGVRRNGGARFPVDDW